MAKNPQKAEAKDGKAAAVEATSTAPVAAAPAVTADEPAVDPVTEPAVEAQPEPTIPGTILPVRQPTLAELNAAAYRAHQEDADFKKRKALAAAAAMERVLRKVQ